MAQPSTTSEPDSGMPSPTEALWGRLPARHLVGRASTPAADLQTRSGQNHQPLTTNPQPRRAKLALVFLLPPLLQAAAPPTYSILSDDQGGWPLLLQSVGFMPQPAASARIFVLRAGSAGSPEWPARVETGAYLILEGESSTAETFGFRGGGFAFDDE